jgi:tRNA nucleotidyltransferase (CCA-adding enzyme)
VDVITSRSERYDVRGALPRVMPAGIRQDLRRRDVTVNAMAIELWSGAFELLDPFGGRGDIGRRRLRVLHPLSFVEDPTRIFRAARYAVRLGFRLDAWTARAEQRALRLVPYPALSGERLVAEIDRTLAEREPETVLCRLGISGAFRLLDARYRFTRSTRARVGELGAALAWARTSRLELQPRALAVVCLLGDQSPDVRAAALRRLGFSGEPLARLGRALEGAPHVRAALEQATTWSGRARVLRRCSATELATLWLGKGPAVRRVLDWFVTEGRGVSSELRGDDLMALGVSRGPDVARVLDDLRDARLDGAIGDRTAETRYVRHWLQPRMED